MLKKKFRIMEMIAGAKYNSKIQILEIKIIYSFFVIIFKILNIYLFKV